MQEQLDTLTTSIGFQIAIVAATLVSLFVSFMFRHQLTAAICGGEVPEYPTTRLRIGANWIVLISLIYFLGVSVQTCEAAQTDAAKRSAFLNLSASMLALTASALRLHDLYSVQQQSAAAADEELEIAELPVI